MPSEKQYSLPREIIRKSELHQKVVCLPVDTGYALFPMLHEIEKQ